MIVKDICGDCGVTEGKIHLLNCDQERCPICNKQLLSCGHSIQDIKDRGLKREPFFSHGAFRCERCEERLPEFKMITKPEWEFICGHAYPLDCVLCPECMDFIQEARRRK